MGIESQKFEPPQERPDLTTPEGRQREIERVFREEKEEELKVKSGLRTPEERQKEIERIMAEEGEEKPKEKSREEIPKTKEVKKEKSPETPQFDLDKTRTDYANAYNEYRNEFGKMKGKDLNAYEKTIESAREKFIKPGDSEKIIEVLERIKPSNDASERRVSFINELEKRGIGIDKAAAIYETELKKAEYETAKVEAGKKLAEQGVSKAEIFKKLILDERELLNQAKIESWPPKEKNLFRKGMEWYMKRGTATRLLISTGLVTGVVAGAGGFGVVAVATYAGYRFVRGFGSVMIAKLAGKGVDMAMSRGIEAKKEAAMEKLKTGFDLEKLQETEKGLEKIFEETAKRERRKLLIKAAVSATAGAGATIGMGILEHAWAGGGVKVAPETLKPKTSTPEKMPAEIAPEVPPKSGVTISPEEIKPKMSAEVAPEIKSEIASIIEIQKGDSVWKLAEKQLEARGYFKGLTGSPEEILAKKRYFIDAIKDKIAENPGKFGIASGDADLIKPGEKIDFSSIFDTKEGKVDLIRHAYRAEGLSETDINSILKTKISLEDAITEKIPTETITEPPTKFVEATPVHPEGTIESSWAEAGKKVEYIDQGFPKVKTTEQIFSEVSPEIGREIITEKLHDYFGMWSGTYDKFSDTKLKDFFELNNASGYRITGAPWEDYDYNKFSGLQNKMEKVYNALDATEKSGVAGTSVETFIKKYFVKIFEGK